MTKTILTSFVAALALCGAAVAGTASVAAGKGKAQAPAAAAAAATPIGLTLTGGYDSTYLWHGTRIGENLFTQKLEYTAAMCDKSSFTIGQWYGHLTEYKYNELDLYASVSYNAGPVTITTGFTYYNYIDGAALDEQYEPFVKVATNGLAVDLYAAYYYETEVSGGYGEVGVSKSFTLSQNVSLQASAVVGYNDGLTTPESGLNHVWVGLALPVAVSANVTLTPYVGGNFAQDATESVYEDKNLLVGGVSVAVRF